MYEDLESGMRKLDGTSWYEGWVEIDGQKSLHYSDVFLLEIGLIPPGYKLIASFDSDSEMKSISQLFYKFERNLRKFR